MSETPRPPDAKKLIAGQVVGGAAGIAIGTYTGAAMLVPALAGAAIWYGGRKLHRPAQPAYLPSLTVQGAHMMWLLVGALVAGAWSSIFLDVVVLAVGLIWLWQRPGLAPVLILSIYQAAALALNATAIGNAEMGSLMHKALTLHIGLRVLALGTLWHAYLRIRRAPDA